MSDWQSAQLVYDQIDAAWREAGLDGRRVKDTPGWEAAVGAVRQYYNQAGWPGQPMGPIDRDKWDFWLHILSHCMEEGHNLSHANCELQLQKLAITALRQHRLGLS